MFSPLFAISPADGRYQKQTEIIEPYFSEFALIKYRVLVEILYFLELANSVFTENQKLEIKRVEIKLKSIIENFSEIDALEIKEIEKTTNHDVKAVEYFLRKKFAEIGLEKYLEFIHFGLTSQDINNTAIPISINEFLAAIFFNQIEKVEHLILNYATEWQHVSMLAKTHGQAASPTTMGKEWYVFYERLNQQINHLKSIPITGKFGGATGNFNAHFVAYPTINWQEFGNLFLENKLQIKRQQTTTQIEHYDWLAALCDCSARINTILIDFARDIWAYVSMDYFKQKIKEGEVGSSAMPHKVNPIDFENAEGNLGFANAMFHFFSSKLPVSRLQRDLTDSTVLRNIGLPFAHTIIALNSLEKGINKLLLNEPKLSEDLESNWAVVAEAVQTILRRENYPDPYNALKELTRINEKITKESLHAFIQQLTVSDEIKNELLQITPHNYTGKPHAFGR